MRRDVKILLSLIIIISFVFGLVSSPKIRAQSLEQLRQRREQLSREIARNQAAANQKKAEAERLAKEIKQIDEDIAATESRIAATQAQIDDSVKTIEVLNIKIAEKQKELEQALERQNEAIRTIYETTGTNFVFLAAGSSITDAVDRAQYLTALEQSIEQTIQEINDLKTQLQSQKKDQEARQAELGELKQKHEAYQRGLDTSKKRKGNLLSNTKIAQAEYERKLAEAKALNARVESQISALARGVGRPGSIIRSKDQGTSPVGFIWPMDYNYTTTEFGPTNKDYPFYQAGLYYHWGTDIVNRVCGTPVFAAADGVANLFGSAQGYGNYIVLGHNARFATLYGHLEGFAVTNGQEVKKGKVIGYEGTTGWSTGCHLHFEVWDNGVRKDPRLYLP